MSWDADLIVTVDDNPIVVYDCNYTHNCNQMIRDAGFPNWWDGFNEVSGKEGAVILESVIRELETHPAKYDLLNPSNGWGCRSTLVEDLSKMLTASRKFPSGVWHVSG